MPIATDYDRADNEDAVHDNPLQPAIDNPLQPAIVAEKLLIF